MLHLLDRTATNDRQNGVRYDPPYCYYEGGHLKFNAKGTNKGSCSRYDVCLCGRKGQSGSSNGEHFNPARLLVMTALVWLCSAHALCSLNACCFRGGLTNPCAVVQRVRTRRTRG